MSGFVTTGPTILTDMEDHDLVGRVHALAAGTDDAVDDDEVLRLPLDEAEERIRHLVLALGHRTVIGQATGIVMERFGLSAEAAFGVLIRLSSEQNTKVFELAARLVSTGDVPGLRHPR